MNEFRNKCNPKTITFKYVAPSVIAELICIINDIKLKVVIHTHTDTNCEHQNRIIIEKNPPNTQKKKTLSIRSMYFSVFSRI